MIDMNIHEKIVVLRKQSGMTQNEVADALNMKRSTYAYCERKATKLTPDFLRQLSAVLHIPSSILLSSGSKSDSAAEPEHLSQEVFPLDNSSEAMNISPKELRLIKMLRILPQDESARFINEIIEAYNNRVKQSL